MNAEKMLGSAVQTLGAVDVGGKKADPGLADLDRGILQVALMISGLDGTVLPEEYAAFCEMATQCRGASVKNIRALYDAAIGQAGRLASMAQSKVYSEASRMNAFVGMAMEALPKGFAHGSMADLRRAFVLWIAMGIADGAFSAFERKAVKALVRRFALLRAAKAKRYLPLIETDFFGKAEKCLVAMAVPARRAKAEAALKTLIETVEIKIGRKQVGRHRAGGISLACPPAGPTISSWR